LSHGVYHNAFTLKEYKEAIKITSKILKRDGLLCFNIFTNEYIEPDIKKVPKEKNVYKTGEGLRMVLLSNNEFLLLAKPCGLSAKNGSIKKYISTVSTGDRSVLRGVLKRR
jgi:hypothetical protein